MVNHMAAIELTKGKQIYQAGQSLTMLHLISKGSVKATFAGGSITLEKGDIIGICEIYSDAHFISYQTMENTSIVTYAYKNEQDLQKLFATNKEFANVFVTSACKQLSALLELYQQKRNECDTYYKDCMDDYDHYKSVCSIYRTAPRSLPDLDELTTLSLESELFPWTAPYYASVKDLFSGRITEFLGDDTWFATGLLYQISASFLKIIELYESVDEYLASISHIYFNKDYIDLFEFYVALALKIGPKSPDFSTVESVIKRVVRFLYENAHTDQELLQTRYSDFQTKLSEVASKSSNISTTNENIRASLHDSMSTLLIFADVEEEFEMELRRLVNEYKNLNDRNGVDDKSRLLRNKISKAYYDLYEIIAKKALERTNIPVIVRMFLYFGYMDEEIAGIDNACYLYELSQSVFSHNDSGVYPFFHWLKAIYEGKKEPSRNEFDEDYTRYIHNLRATNKISDDEISRYLIDPWYKVQYEIRNMFIPVNKMTFGRISTFCPIFSEHNVLKDLDRAYVSTHKVGDAFATICAIDYSAFYRETLYASPDPKVNREYIHTEVLPDVILMPNVGIRGVMWQEIEGKKRTTPARMMVSLFQLEDLLGTMIRLTGEFRWEMCKRIQGPRWNDISERSLTSEYCDYIQFYRKNIELSVDAKEKVHASLQKAKNSFKEMFVRDYITWIQYEGTGSPRLNKVARNILFTHCTFTKKVREKLLNNPQYKELLARHSIKASQKVHRMEGVIQKLNHNGIPVPPEFEAELEFLKS